MSVELPDTPEFRAAVAEGMLKAGKQLFPGRPLTVRRIDADSTAEDGVARKDGDA